MVSVEILPDDGSSEREEKPHTSVMLSDVEDIEDTSPFDNPTPGPSSSSLRDKDIQELQDNIQEVKTELLDVQSNVRQVKVW